VGGGVGGGGGGGGTQAGGMIFAGEMESRSNGVSQGFTFFILFWCMGGH